MSMNNATLFLTRFTKRIPTRSSRATLSSFSIEEVQLPKVHTIICGVVHISEGRDNAVLDKLAQIAHTTAIADSEDMDADMGAALVTDFRDRIYNRSSFIIGGTPTGVAAAATAVCRQALQEVDLRSHEAIHPRLGVIDHVSCHPVGLSVHSEVEAAKVGKTIARMLGKKGIPVLLYGDLKDGKRLSKARRSTPYFSRGAVPETIESDIGPKEVNSAKGITTVGCTPLVTNYNLLLDTTDNKLARAVTRGVRGKDGGFSSVEALTLRRPDGRYETACSLLQPSKTTPAMVLAKAQEHAEKYGVSVVEDHAVGLCEEDAMRKIVMKMVTR